MASMKRPGEGERERKKSVYGEGGRNVGGNARRANLKFGTKPAAINRPSASAPKLIAKPKPEYVDDLPEPGGHPRSLTEAAEAKGRKIPAGPFGKLKAMHAAMSAGKPVPEELLAGTEDAGAGDQKSQKDLDSLFVPTRELERPTRTRDELLRTVKKLRGRTPILRKTQRLIEAEGNDESDERIGPGSDAGSGTSGDAHASGTREGGRSKAADGSESSADRTTDETSTGGMGGGSKQLGEDDVAVTPLHLRSLTNGYCAVCDHDHCICPRAGEGGGTESDSITEGHITAVRDRGGIHDHAQGQNAGDQVSGTQPKLHLPVIQEGRGQGEAPLRHSSTSLPSLGHKEPALLVDENDKVPGPEEEPGFTPYSERQELEAGMLMGGIPGIACNGCAAAESCPEFLENSTCAYDDYFSGLSTRDVNNLLPRMEVIADMQFRRGMHAAYVERRKSGGQLLPEVTRQLEIAAIAAERVARLKTPQHRDMRQPVVVIQQNGGGGGLVSRLLAGVTGILPQQTGDIVINAEPVNTSVHTEPEAVHTGDEDPSGM